MGSNPTSTAPTSEDAGRPAWTGPAFFVSVSFVVSFGGAPIRPGSGEPAVTCSSERKHSVSVAGIIVDAAGRALLVQRRDNGHWEPPGGVLELDESISDGLRREVSEETGLDIQPERLTGICKNMPLGVVALVSAAASRVAP